MALFALLSGFILDLPQPSFGADMESPQPKEPETRNLTSKEADKALVRDWLFQADDQPTWARAKQEIKWARKLAARLAENPQAPDLSPELKELDALERGFVKSASESGPKQPLRQPELPGGQLACWTFDEADGAAVKDSSGKSLDGKMSGRAVRVPGVFGNALSLDGRSLVNTGSQLASIAKGNYTICAWINTRSREADILGNGVGKGHFLFMTYRGVVRGHHWTASSGNVIDGKTRVNDGRWHHVAQVVDDGAISIFVDGRQDATMEFKGEKTSNSNPVLIGSRSLRGRARFTGRLDHVCVFDRPLLLEEIKAQFAAGEESVGTVDEEAEDFYLAVRRVKRRIMFKNPVVDFGQVMFIDNPFPQGREWPHQARHRNGMMAVPGGRLLMLDGLSPGGKIRKLAPEKPGSFWRFDLSFDARKVLFCYWAWDEKSFHLYEINVDGTGLKQLTFGDYDDIDPIYLPDGHIMFTSTRSNTYVRCMPYTYSYVLARCDADGRNIYLISRNSEPDWLPTLLNDGRVIYSRWEYTDKALWRIQSLWTINQDGTNVATFWGNQSVWPDHLAEAMPIPGSDRVMFTGLAHHNWFAGSIGILDTKKGRNFPHGLTKVTGDVPWPECGRPPTDTIEAGDHHASGHYQAYKTPYPLSEEDFLVSAKVGSKFVLLLMDVHGNRELIYEGAYNVWHAMPVRQRIKPPVQPDLVAWPGTGSERKTPKMGVIFSPDVYEGVPDLPKGKARFLRVLQMDAKTYSLWNRDARFSGPSISALQEDGVKRILGTVPVESDGSVHLEVPAGKALHFQILDEKYRALQTMRTFTGVMPGERRGCVGCHEQHSTAPSNGTGLAMKRPPSKLELPPWGTQSISYERMVQPVLDRHCGKCHQGKGEARKDFDLTLRPGRSVFKEPYLSLIGKVQVARPGQKKGIAGAIMCENFRQSDPNSYTTTRPMQHLSYRSKLIDFAMSGKHYDVKVDPVSLRTLIGWVDANCPYRGDEDVRALPDPKFTGIERLPIQPKCRTAPIIARP